MQVEKLLYSMSDISGASALYAFALGKYGIIAYDTSFPGSQRVYVKVQDDVRRLGHLSPTILARDTLFGVVIRLEAKHPAVALALRRLCTHIFRHQQWVGMFEDNRATVMASIE